VPAAKKKAARRATGKARRASQRTGIDFAKMQTFDVVVEGQHLRVRLDKAGNPISLSTACWVGGDGERIAKLAIKAARADFERAAQLKREANAATARKTSSKKAAKKSAIVRGAAAAEHWSLKWFKQAHEKDPYCGARELRRIARQLLRTRAVSRDATDDDKTEYASINQISKHRAEKFRAVVPKRQSTP